MALQIIEEICEDEENIKLLVKDSASLPDAPFTSQYMMQYLMTDEGFQYLMQKQKVDQQLDLWMNQEKWKYLEDHDFKTSQYLEIQVDQNIQNGYRYITYHSLTNPHFSYTSVYLATILRLPWNIQLSIQTSKDQGEDIWENMVTQTICLKINVEYNSKDDYLVLVGDVKPGQHDDFDSYEVKVN